MANNDKHIREHLGLHHPAIPYFYECIFFRLEVSNAQQIRQVKHEWVSISLLKILYV